MKKILEEKVGKLKYLISMENEEQELIKKGEQLIKQGNREFIDAKIDNEKMNIMLFTSGTTSASKIVALSHKNLVSNLMDISSILDVNSDDVFLSFLPIHHVFECTVGFLYPISIGGSIAFCEGVKHMADNIKEFGITAMISVPAVFDIIYRKVMKTIEKKGKMATLEKGKKISNVLLKVKIDLRKQLFKEVHESLGPKLKLVVTGGAALDPETEKGFNDLGFDVEQGYGLTETAPVIAAETPKYRRLGSIGKKFPSVEVKIDGHKITVKGPKGTLEREVHKNISLEMNDNVIKVTRKNDEPANRSLHGLTRTLINNMIIGVTHEYTKELQINGVGYRVAKQGTGINMTLGYSHPVIMEAPEGITFDVPNANTIIVRGIDKELVGQTAAVVRSKRPPEVYRGKGIKYADEVIRRKEGKTGK